MGADDDEAAVDPLNFLVHLSYLIKLTCFSWCDLFAWPILPVILVLPWSGNPNSPQIRISQLGERIACMYVGALLDATI